MHRIFEIIDEEKNENFTADNAAEKEVDKTIIIDDEADEAVKKKSKSNKRNKRSKSWIFDENFVDCFLDHNF